MLLRFGTQPSSFWIKALLAFNLMIQTGCMKITDIEEAEIVAPVKESNTRIYSQNWRPTEMSSIYAANSPNSYAVALEPGLAKNIFRKKVSSGFESNNLGILAEENFYYLKSGLVLDASVESGSSYSYFILQNDSYKEVLRVSIPKDLFIQNRFFWDPSIKVIDFRRLYLGHSSVLVTNGQDVELKFIEIHSQGGKIETFVQGQVAAQGEHGRSGGNVKITSPLATGHLQVILRGEQGGQGISGLSHPMRARQGHPSREIEFVSGRETRCRITDPGHGADGLNGGDGGPGMSGGDSGELILDIRSPQFDVQVTKAPGAGGIGGKAGAGQLGGFPGSLIENKECLGGSRPGKAGRDGKDGTPGKPGVAGEEQRACLFLFNYSGCI